MTVFAKLNKLGMPPRKVRLVANAIRRKYVTDAIAILEHQAKRSAEPIKKLLLSAANNWEQKNDGKDWKKHNLIIKEIKVDAYGKIIKRIKPAPQGRAHRIRRRSSSVTVALISPNQPTSPPVEQQKNDETAKIKTVQKEEIKNK